MSIFNSPHDSFDPMHILLANYLQQRKDRKESGEESTAPQYWEVDMGSDPYGAGGGCGGA